MNPRRLEWNDLEVNGENIYEMTSTKGESKVYVRLRGCAFVGKTFWISGWNRLDPSPIHRAMILLQMHKLLASALVKLGGYVAPIEPVEAVPLDGGQR